MTLLALRLYSRGDRDTSRLHPPSPSEGNDIRGRGDNNNGLVEKRRRTQHDEYRILPPRIGIVITPAPVRARSTSRRTTTIRC
mmetsp:Transcript_28068/g.67618  ORF Transcript_28068/g.67618 Transcript_28068/m.67618 type:complete len:83 (+) Transcript_28068:630-878(+)